MNTGYYYFYHIRILHVQSFKMRGNNIGFRFHWAELLVFEEFWVSIIFDLSSISWEIHIRLWLKVAFLDSAHSELSFKYKQDRVWIKTVFSTIFLIWIIFLFIVRINAQLLGGQLFFENTSGCPLDDGIIFFWYRVMPHESESYGQRGLSLITFIIMLHKLWCV